MSRRPPTLQAVVLVLLLFQPLTNFAGMVSSEGIAGSGVQGAAAGSLTSSSNNSNANPLPPGTASSTYFVNGTSDNCTPVPRPQFSQIPEIKQNGWNIMVNYPTEVFAGNVVGVDQQTYSFSGQGGFVVTDDNRNGFAWSGLKGLPPGEPIVGKLIGNSTFASQNYAVASAGQIIANVTVSYDVRYGSCGPSGMEVLLSGWANWPAGSSNNDNNKEFSKAGPNNNGNGNSSSEGSAGSIGLQFDRAPVTMQGQSVWFGSKYGTIASKDAPTANDTKATVEFDWSDSGAYNPKFTGANNTISWYVGHSFNIDPVIVASNPTQDGFDIGLPSARQLDVAAGNYWLFYTNGTSMVYQSSLDGITWSKAANAASPSTCTITSLTGSEFCGNGISQYSDDLSTWVNPSTNTVYVVSAPAADSSTFFFRYGVMQAAGTIAWSIPDQLITVNGGYLSGSSSITQDSQGNVWVTMQQSCNNDQGSQTDVWKYNSSNNTWSLVYQGTCWSTWTSSLLVPLTDSIALIMSPSPKQVPCSTCYQEGSYLSITTTTNGVLWTSPVYSNDVYFLPDSSTVAVGNTLYLGG